MDFGRFACTDEGEEARSSRHKTRPVYAFRGRPAVVRIRPERNESRRVFHNNVERTFGAANLCRGNAMTFVALGNSCAPLIAHIFILTFPPVGVYAFPLSLFQCNLERNATSLEDFELILWRPAISRRHRSRAER